MSDQYDRQKAEITDSPDRLKEEQARAEKEAVDRKVDELSELHDWGDELESPHLNVTPVAINEKSFVVTLTMTGTGDPEKIANWLFQQVMSGGRARGLKDIQLDYHEKEDL